MEIEAGSIFGLLGPNGAGKTSLIRIITQITAPDEGEIFFKGEKLSPRHVSQMGYLPEERGLYKKMEIGEQMIYLAQLKGLSRADAIARFKYWFEKLEIQSWWKKKVEDLSKGMQQKVQFIATVLHEPQLIILDEPFSGFDPVNADIIRDEIVALNKKGATIIFSTHRMESVEELCDSIALIDRSRKILDGRVIDIRNSYRNNNYMVEYAGNRYIPAEIDPFEVTGETQGCGSITITVKLKEGRTSNDLLSSLLPNVRVNMLKEVIPTMHEIFIEKVSQIR
jgi:ABC-2 type transport system ATP-binding protein